VERTNEQWLRDLSEPGAARERALADLGRILRSGLPFALSTWLPRSDPKFDPLVGDVVQETLLKVVDRLHTFEGRSKFTTWAQKIAVRIALSELRRKRWQDRSFDELVAGQNALQVRLAENPQGIDPERAVLQSDMLARVQRIIAQELTEKQRTALLALGVQGMPAEEVARRLGMTRNALYKLMHDARVRLKDRLAAEGLDAGQVLAVFETG